MKKCKTGKRRFGSELSAKIVLAKLVHDDKGHQRAYACKFCGGYHLTSQQQRTELVSR